MKTTYNFDSETDRNLIVNDFFNNKPRADYYAVTYRRFFYEDFDCDDFTPEYLKTFTPEQIKLIQELVAVCKEEDIDLSEAMADDEKYNFLNQEVDESYWYLVPQSIDLDTVYHRYEFKYGYFIGGIEEQPRVIKIKAELSDDEYKSLLAWRLKHKSAGFMTLRHELPALFEKLATRFDGIFASVDWIQPYEAPIYVVEMTEIDQDAKAIMEQFS